MLRWYDADRRPLPWRESRDAYRVCVSEIMLQQTRAAVVAERYPEFLRRFPNVRTLARARVSTVLAAWSGLGYYRRARALHAAARAVVRQHAGVFPQTAEDLRLLPGIGRYTAAAIASIAFDQRCAVVDGNVERVLQRLIGRSLSHREAWPVAEALLSAKRPGDFNQAMMELGATLCGPGTPRCETCAVRRWCATFAHAPHQSPRAGFHDRTKPARRQKDISYAFALSNGRVLLTQRGADAALMPGMWELPEATSSSEVLMRLRHAITTTDYRITIVAAQERGHWIRLPRVRALPLTGVTRKVLRCLGII